MNFLGTGAQRAAKGSAVLVGGTLGTALAFSAWSATESAQDLPTVNFTSFSSSTNISYGEGTFGVSECQLQFGGDWDASANPMDDPPGIYVRDDLDGLVFMENVNDVIYWLFDYARLRSTTNGAEVRGLVTFNASGMSQGPYQRPSGNA
jgi:hypothetical protein